MQELLAQISGYFWGVWRYKWLALVVAWLAAIGGWLWVAQLPVKYQASARIHVDTNSLLRPLLRGLAIQPDINQRVTLMSRTLLSRPNLEKLMRMSDLDLRVKTEADKERMLSSLRGNVRLSGTRRNSSLYSLSFKHPNRDTALQVVQSLITVFVETTLGEQEIDGAGVQEFIGGQISDYEARLIEAEQRLATFKQENVGMLPGQTGDFYQRLESAKSRLSTARLQLREMENRRRELRRQLAGEEPIFGLIGSDEFKERSALNQRIRALERKLDELLLRYTERHPEVVQVKALIVDLEKDKARRLEEAAATPEPMRKASLANSPVYQQMRTMLAESEATVAELEVRTSEYAERVAQLESKVENVPLVEAELKQLNRDYEVIAKQHAALLGRRESAHITEKVEQNASDVKFRVVDPPFVPLRPTEPNKVALNLAVLVGAISAGLGVALLISLFRPIITNRTSLAQITGLPVLGSVMWIQSASERKKGLREGILFSCVGLGLVGAFTLANLSLKWM